MASLEREAVVEDLAEAGVLDALDGALAEALIRLAHDTDPRVALGIALASRAIRRGDVCADLPALAATPVSDDDGTPIPGLTWPAIDVWLLALAASPVTTTLHPVRAANPIAPLVLHLPAGRLYLRRYWSHETRLADVLLARADADDLPHDAKALRTALASLFGAAFGSASADDAVDRQAVAAWVAVRRPLTVVSGGPGTGKTTTVVRILALLIDQARAAASPPPRIALLAPTGKAAARLAEAVGAAGASLRIDDAVRAALPTAAQTIHRALGLRRDGRRSGAGADRPLAADIVVVDEASMVDLVLMRRLVDAVRPDARLIVLGDQDQLSSVDAGAVLGDLCGGDRALAYQAALASAYAAFVAPTTGHTTAPTTGPTTASNDDGRGGRADARIDDVTSAAPGDACPLASSVILLTHSHRFGAASGIGRLARAIHDGDADAALALLADPAAADVTRIAAAPTGRDGRLSAALHAAVIAGYGPVVRAADPAGQLDALETFRVLCAHRHGPAGVEPLNARIVTALAVVRGGTAAPPSDARAIIVRQNDYAVGLYNGDVGIIARSPADGAARATFRLPDGRLRDLSPARLPPHETAFALSIHQSQGSEFDAVVVVLPDGGSPLLSRELLYTAVTRARRHVLIFGTDEAIRLAIGRRSVRASGLRERLWGAGSVGQ